MNSASSEYLVYRYKLLYWHISYIHIRQEQLFSPMLGIKSNSWPWKLDIVGAAKVVFSRAHSPLAQASLPVQQYSGMGQVGQARQGVAGLYRKISVGEAGLGNAATVR